MRLTQVHAVLDDRLNRDVPHPVAVGFSGGGDSLALLLAARDWAASRGRRLLVLSVDHGLQAQAAGWTRTCAATAERLGLPFQALAWAGEKPRTGLAAAARAARHRLLADAARAAGARVILLGHTADDRLEAGLMRAAGSATPDPRLWAPSPAWPQGRGVFLLRPLLDQRRAALRDWLRQRGEAWIDDPANEDPRSARARARAALDLHEPALALGANDAPETAGLARLCVATAWGGLAIPREALRQADPAAAGRFLAAACLCAAGGARPPRGGPLQRLVAGARSDAPVTATLVGARIEADADTVRLWREPGEAARGGLAPLPLPAGLPTVWDGRYELLAHRPGLVVRRLAGGAARLSAPARRALAAAPAPARGALPAVVDAAGAFACPVLAPVDGVSVSALAKARLLAACGAATREPA